MRAGAVTLPATYTPANEQTWSWRSVVYQNGRATLHYMAPGASSRNISNCFATSSTVWKLTPVALPPGRLRLGTRPIATGSLPIAKTIGMVVVAALVASDAATAWRSRPPAGGSDRRPSPAADRPDPPPSGIRSPRSDLRP